MDKTMIILTIKENAEKIYVWSRTGLPFVSEKKAVRVLNISDEAVAFFKSEDAGQAFKIKKRDWNFMKPKQRVEAALSSIAEGNPFSYEVEN